MNELLAQIESSLKNNEFYLALFVSLAMPDICGALGSKNGQANGNRYKAWFDKYVSHNYRGNLDGSNCYAFRCATLHQGRAKHKNLGYSRILFADPASSGIVMHNNVLNDALNIDVRHFCQDIVKGVRAWLKDMTGNVNFDNHYLHFLKRHKGGLAPYISGIDVFS